MPRSLSPIPPGVAITDGKGIITIFFRLAWQLLVDGFQITPTIGTPVDEVGLTAAFPTTALHTTLVGGPHRVNYSLVRTVDDGAASSGTVTIAWTQNGVPRSETAAALTEAAGLSVQGLSRPIFADVNSTITIRPRLVRVVVRRTRAIGRRGTSRADQRRGARADRPDERGRGALCRRSAGQGQC